MMKNIPQKPFLAGVMAAMLVHTFAPHTLTTLCILIIGEVFGAIATKE
jgi:hypothetical protein